LKSPAFLGGCNNLFNPSGLILRFGFVGAAGLDSPRVFADLALCAAAILLRAAALIFRPLRGVGSDTAGAPWGDPPLSIARSSAIFAVNPSMAAQAAKARTCKTEPKRGICGRFPELGSTF
jgi:hypothetical protein